MTHRRLLALYVALCILHIVPVWSVDLLPLGDGASHVYNAWMGLMRPMAGGRA